ncbi:glycosyltransferase family 2 protein [Siccirubricoccus sp. KC 17139]|uniref:Glycosyltransferase family 2 protein n=1 Tax=Siccirubricoccus soli TaxID=2899147 RepID=A0ABT1D406_9PROT|nr:glycosyltransferase family 2 protein [Siccirubricoccus soli]MCO6416660.1 glycosyltransferase family 2 protein [Siccirubricoccus soli]MCP2682795.1 glycosyltransferase family 2 protein [Siccirubricoccus soli]
MGALLVAAWLAGGALALLGCAWTLHLLRRPQPQPTAEPPVLVVVPVRGAEGLPRFLAGLAAQDWPEFRVVFAVESQVDPAVPLLRAALPGRSALVLAGPAARRGQKLQNLLAALPALRPGDAALVTLDADTAPPPGLLRALLRPVLAGQAEIASGYRWTLAAPGAGWAAQSLALVDAGIGTLPRCAACNICWGGATAIRADALARLDLPRLWDRAISDDLTLTRAARRLGMVIYAPLTVRPPGEVAGDAASTLRFGIRQYRLLRLHLPRAWALAGLAAGLPVLGAGAALLGGHWAAFPAALLLQAGRGWLRRRIAARVLPPGEAARVPAWQPWLGPPAALLHLAAWLGSAGGREIAWAGRRYRLGAAGEVLRLRTEPG